jgi:ubiquinone/menaquinone biosynthesis C-methylase UbiE
MNTQWFTGKAELYKKYRPSYPKEFLDYLYSTKGFSSDSIIADVGAGTGIFTKLLLERGSTVYAVEPNDDMRETAVGDLTKYDRFTPVSATAENTKLPEKCVDFVTVTEAFHYFDRQLFKQECMRILKPCGKVVLAWNRADKDSSLVKKQGKIIEKYSQHDDNVYQRSGNTYEFSDFFKNGIYEYKTYKNDLHENREQFIGGHLSAGFAPIKDTHPEEYKGYVKDLNILFDEYSENELIRFPFITNSYVGIMV